MSRATPAEGAPARRSGRPTGPEARRKSETVLRAATELFVERGVDGTTMEAVAAAAEIGKQALYSRYANKEELFAAVVADLARAPIAAHPAMSPDEPLAAGLKARIEDFLRHAYSPQADLMARLALREGHRNLALVELLRVDAEQRMIGPLRAYLDARVAAGEARCGDTLAIASFCIDLIFAKAMRASFRRSRLPAAQIRAQAEAIAALLLPALLAG